MANHIFAAQARMALLCGALVALGACGDDGDGGDDKVVTDSGTPPDSGTPADSGAPVDSGAPPDAATATPDAGATNDAGSAEVAAALDRTGIKASAARASIIYPLACKNAVTCKKEENEAECASGYRADYDEAVTKGFTDACLDATLDFFSCFATAACANFDSECGPLYQTQLSICPKTDAGT